MKSKPYFPKIKVLCACVNDLEQSTTNIFFTFYPKIKNLSTYKHDTSLENLLLHLDLVQTRSKELGSS